MNPTITSAELNDGRPEITPAAGPREGDTKLQLLARILDAVKDGVGGGAGAKLVTVADDAAFAALTSDDVNIGDFVYIQSSLSNLSLPNVILKYFDATAGPAILSGYAMSSRVEPAWLIDLLAGSLGSTKTALGIIDTQTVGNANATITDGKTDVQLTAALTAARVYTLPLASAYPAGASITFTDIANTITSANTATLQRAGSDTINGATSMVISTAGASPVLISDGTSKWNMDIRGIARGGTGATTAAGAAVNIVNGNPINPSSTGVTTPGPIVGTTVKGATDGQFDIIRTYTGGNAQVSFATNGYFACRLAGMDFRANSSSKIKWSSDATDALSGSVDVAISRNAAGVLEVNSGTAGTFRALCGSVLEAKTALQTASFTVATLPSASTYARGIIYVSDESGGATIAFSDGTNWRRVADRAIVS